jgi:hypothetical protein
MQWQCAGAAKFIGLTSPHMGIMAQCEQKTMYFRLEDAINYIDLAACVTASNRKQFHQVSTDGTPLCYSFKITGIKGDTTVDTVQTQFLICNAVKQTTAGWKAQLRHAGVRLKDLPSYGRRPRFAMDTASVTRDITAITGEAIYGISGLHLGPRMSPGGDNYFSPYTSTDGMSVKFRTLDTPAVGSVTCNMITQVTVTDGAGTESQEPLVLTGLYTVVGEFNVISNYLQARRATPDVSIDTPGPSKDSDMLNLFSVSEELSDDIVGGVEEYMDWKPYTPDKSGNNYTDLCEAAEVSSITAVDTQYPPNVAFVDAPLGLLKVSGVEGNDIRIDMVAIYEM